MYNNEPTDYVCPFCQILRGEPTLKGGHQESTIITRNELVTTFIAGKWWRAAPAHVLVIPTEHIENLYSIPPEVGAAIFESSRQMALAMKETYGCDGVSVRQHNETAGDQDVWHYHMHVFPRWNGKDLYRTNDDTYWPSLEEKQPYADKLIAWFAKD